MLRSFLILMLAGSAATAQTTAFDGDWAMGDPAACVVGTDNANLALRIQNGALNFYESACALTNPTAVRGMEATLFDLQCNGEGETWSYRALFMIDHQDALIFVQNGSVQILPRCAGSVHGSPPAAAPTK